MIKGQVIIVGAGVLGLSCAVQLSRSGYTVTVIARDLPGDSHIDYASPWAGAHFRPSPAKTPVEQLEQQLMRDTYTELERLAKEYPESGVKIVPAIEYFDSAEADSFLAKENGYIDWPDFRILQSEEYPADHESIQLGVTYRSWVLNSPVYLQWCRKRAEEQGVGFVRATVASMDEAVSIFQQEKRGNEGSDIRAVINATGRGLNDPDSFPSRGQFIIVSNQCDKTISHHWADGSSTVVIPRPLGGGTVIGGTKEPNNWSEDISDTATETILTRVAGICPELIDRENPVTENTQGFDIRQVYIARRPMRRGGLRLEKENMNQGIPLIHCYGAGASGFKISWGVARQVELLVADTQLLVNNPLETS
ncbi:FAD dependent oxidoreductase superfamily [Penicillium brasilianum]|uniref:FAD dependent oxidoreductase superfamily n=1 Tax=Penicillium brasilianum TaxID=104259 RepID=A0A1S9RFH2_PENBI|nr:FAD dependent oxidoreductase superfamily [Penicillium brasilianum]